MLKPILLSTAIILSFFNLQAQLNLREPANIASEIDIDFINRLMYIFFSQYLTIITKHANLFSDNNHESGTYQIKYNDTYLTVCTLDNIAIKKTVSNRRAFVNQFAIVWLFVIHI